MSEPRVVLSEALPPTWVESLDAVGGAIVGLDAADPTTVHALLTTLNQPVDAAVLDRFPGLRVVSNMAVGVDNIDLASCATRGIPVGNTPGVLTDATADLAMALLLSAARGIGRAARDAREGRWGPWSPTGWLGADLRDRVLGIVGAGAIGQAVARRAAAFGMTLLYANRSARPEFEADTGARRVGLHELLSASDFVSLHVALTAETRHLIDAESFSLMKANAILINTARGDVVEQDALVAALEARAIAGAALDVTTPEPLPPEHALFAEPRCLVVPHIGSATHDTRRRMAELACANVLAGLRGDPLPHPVRL
jgi:lactate dehydrogenase-like 2-hydroxyacid dehydrogenase